MTLSFASILKQELSVELIEKLIEADQLTSPQSSSTTPYDQTQNQSPVYTKIVKEQIKAEEMEWGKELV